MAAGEAGEIGYSIVRPTAFFKSVSGQLEVCAMTICLYPPFCVVRPLVSSKCYSLQVSIILIPSIAASWGVYTIDRSHVDEDAGGSGCDFGGVGGAAGGDMVVFGLLCFSSIVQLFAPWHVPPPFATCIFSLSPSQQNAFLTNTASR